MIYPSKSEVRPATILVNVQLQKTAAEEHGASLQELRQLVETLGWDIVGPLTQKLQSTAASLIGPGKLNELSELVKAPSVAESVVFDHELTPTQVRNIREATGVEVYDRPAIDRLAIILEIFHRHARTKEALPGTTEKFCWGCSVDFATIIVLTDAIDSATLAGVSTDDLQSELCDISRRMLNRAQLRSWEMTDGPSFNCAKPGISPNCVTAISFSSPVFNEIQLGTRLL